MFDFLILFTIILLFSLIVYIFVSDFRKNNNLYFVILFMVSLFFFLNRFFYLSTQKTVYMDAYVISLIFLPAILLWLSTKYPSHKQIIDLKGYEDTLYFVPSLLLVALFYFGTSSMFRVFLSLFYLIYLIIIIHNFVVSIINLNDFKSEKSAFVVGGILIFYIVGLGSFVFFNNLSILDFKLDSISAICMVFFVSYCAIKYGLFESDPTSESGIIKTSQKVNRCYIVKSQNHGVKVLVNKLKYQPGIGFVRTNPKIILDENKLTNTNLYWISEGNDGGTVSPTDLEKILFISKKFFGRSNNGVILLDGIEYLLSFNKFSAVYRFLQQLKDDAYLLDGEIIVPINKKAFDKDKYNLLMRDFEEI